MPVAATTWRIVTAALLFAAAVVPAHAAPRARAASGYTCNGSGFSHVPHDGGAITVVARMRQGRREVTGISVSPGFAPGGLVEAPAAVRFGLIGLKNRLDLAYKVDPPGSTASLIEVTVQWPTGQTEMPVVTVVVGGSSQSATAHRQEPKVADVVAILPVAPGVGRLFPGGVASVEVRTRAGALIESAGFRLPAATDWQAMQADAIRMLARNCDAMPDQDGPF